MSPVEGVSGVSGVSPLSGVLAASRAAGAADVPPAGDASGFASAMVRHLDGVQAMQADADTLAVQAATGDLQDVHDYTIAATQARIATELTVAVRNKAVEAFSEIMRMQA